MARAAGRKHVTVPFANLVGSTALGERLDPETLQTIMDRYYELASDLRREFANLSENECTPIDLSSTAPL